MNVRRQYILPNCTLILEGFSDISSSNAQDELLTILVNAECYFVGIPQKLQGGRTFLENLVKSVSAYAQEYLSGIPHPQNHQSSEDKIDLETIPGDHLHRLTWYPSISVNNSPVELILTTVQLFDLVEGIDQFFADSRTLPDLTLKLQPVSRRYRPPDEPLAQRVIPASLGMASLVVAAFVLFLLPIPQVREPEPKTQPTPTQPLPNTTPSPSPNTGSTPSNP
ncbi:DUF4335 domain-containing protein [Aphanothece sacrum]|uniref:DUF4335 domain-containing protein n=1 Tax=Aphanothece sacrum FPU1 TaxID=1920663 RepID=A0A401IKU7_APHSA|nr:DUF4335 domain-containing protein [Aphanothece sacrum]GBF81866.1 hypothetical protein AsFPU1_3288 [Aphanothece sacrum FPU1]GBF85685.1 hypothetical protein AsFPU3_2750 [Aphanothece sacrum FPU3]